MSVLAVDLGGSHIGCAVVNQCRVLASSTIETDARSLKQLLPALGSTLLAHCRDIGIRPSACNGIGIGYPGIVDSQEGEILSTLGKFDDVTVADLRQWSKREFALALSIENDAKLALLGEHIAGAAKGFEDVVMVTLGTGIGVAVMLQNRLLRSRMGQAGSLGGHLTVRLNGRKCVCGAIGCAEAEASTSTLPAICREWPGFSGSQLAREPQLNFAALFRCKDAGDRVADKVLEHCIAVWSVLTVTLIHAYGPQMVLIGGGVMARAEEILPSIRTYVDQHSCKTSRGAARIEASHLGSNAALIGAETLFCGEAR